MKEVQVPVEVDTSSVSNPAAAVFDDDTSKLTFKEKMTLFSKTKSHGPTPSYALKASRNRLTQVVPIHIHVLISMTNRPHKCASVGGEREGRVDDSKGKRDSARNRASERENVSIHI